MKGKIPELAVTGIDGAGKSTAVDTVLRSISSTESGTFLKMSRPISTYRDGEKTSLVGKYWTTMDRLHKVSDSSRSHTVILAINGLSIVAQSRLLSDRLASNTNANEMWWARDMVVDPSVYSSFYTGRFGRMSPESRIKTFKNITGRLSDLIFHLAVDPELAIERINGRITNEVLSTEHIDHAKWRHLHETPEDLKMLAGEYDEVLKAHQRLYGVGVLTINTDNRTADEVAEIITAYRGRDRESLPSSV